MSPNDDLPQPPTTRPPLGSATRFLLWQAGRQRSTLLAGIFFGVVWMVAQAIWPLLLGRAIDAGTTGADGGLLPWLIALVVVVLVQAGAGVMRHRTAVVNRLRASLGIARLIGHHAADTGRAITADKTTGEIVATVSADSNRLGAMFDILARLIGSIVAWLAITAILFASSVELGLVVLIGVPLSAALLAVLVRPLARRQLEQRAEFGALATLGADAVAGLRVLRGVGGEEEFVGRYAARSQRVRGAGVRVAAVASLLDGAQVLIPGLFLTGVVLYGARLVLVGAATPGELVTLYGYAAFLVLPIRTAVEALGVFSRGIVGTRRVIDVLSVESAVRDGPHPDPAPPLGSELHDVASGVTISPGLLTAIVDEDPDAAAEVATRLGRFDDLAAGDAPVLWGGIDQTSVPVTAVRKRIVVNDAMPHMFKGSLIEGLDIQPVREPERVTTDTGQLRRVEEAIDAAAATETVSNLPKGLYEPVPERGRSFSGGERQRLSLARALLTDAEVLVLIEPTSAVDSRTEQRIAERLSEARAGRTTVVVSASPLLLAKAQKVAVLSQGHLVGEGRHEDLLRRTDGAGRLYRSIVTRGTAPDPEDPRAPADR
ncbi:MAG: transporter transrane region [Naasia sp.]|uniref:ABC transporter ATP-binding protein n=1 Tax=Naasia sp. TaxID=2546198 RepID=UPI0026290EE3|nr:ABC transporter ATP-binding protein [Naasia sp.]MCU1570697.1 transporter transrane region [Naasia sp.]